MKISENRKAASLASNPHAELFPNQRRNRFLHRFFCVGGCIIVKHIHFMLSLAISWSFFNQSFMRIDHLLSPTLGINGFARFQQFIIYHSPLIPPNTKHCLPSIELWSCIRCRRFSWSYAWTFTLRILQIDPFFVISHNWMEKVNFVPSKQNFASDFFVFLLSFSQCIWNPFSHLLNLERGFWTYANCFSCHI